MNRLRLVIQYVFSIISNAVTRTSQDVEDYDRATELEEIEWKVATMENGLWEHLNGNAYIV